MRLANKAAVITGSSRSIGAAVAKKYAKEGAQVVVNYRSHPDLAKQVVKEICSQGGEAIAVQADVSREEDVARLVENAAQRFGKIDILVNNAAMDPRRISCKSPVFLQT